MQYVKSKRYNDYHKEQHNIGGPGGLEIAEFLAEKMSMQKGGKLIDIGFFRGYQTCFLAKEYGVDIVAIDPGGSIFGVPYGIETLMDNARKYSVEDQILGIKTGVPDTLLPGGYFDYAYTTTCLEMLRLKKGADGYLEALKEIYRILKNGGVLGIGEPMCAAGQILDEIAACCREYHYDKCFVTALETKNAVAQAGFKVLDYGNCEEAEDWWREHISHDDPHSDYRKAIERMLDCRWLSFGYVIAVKE